MVLCDTMGVESIVGHTERFSLRSELREYHK